MMFGASYLLTFIVLGANRGPTDCQCHVKSVSVMPYTKCTCDETYVETCADLLTGLCIIAQPKKGLCVHHAMIPCGVISSCTMQTGMQHIPCLDQCYLAKICKTTSRCEHMFVVHSSDQLCSEHASLTDSKCLLHLS